MCVENVGPRHQTVGNKKRGGIDLAVGWRQGVQPPSELNEFPCAKPTAERCRDFFAAGLPRTQPTRLEYGFILNEFQKLCEFHCSI